MIISWGKLIVGLVAGFVISVAVRAKMVPVSAVETEGRQSARVCSGIEGHHTDSASLFDYPSVTDLKLEAVQLSPEAGIDLVGPSHTQPPQRPDRWSK